LEYHLREFQRVNETPRAPNLVGEVLHLRRLLDLWNRLSRYNPIKEMATNDTGLPMSYFPPNSDTPSLTDSLPSVLIAVEDRRLGALPCSSA